MADDLGDSHNGEVNSTDEVITDESKCVFCDDKAHEICVWCKKQCCHYHEKNHKCVTVKVGEVRDLSIDLPVKEVDNVAEFLDTHETYKESKSDKKLLKYIPYMAVALAIGIGGFVIFDYIENHNWYENDVLTNVTEMDCKGFYAEGDFLLVKNSGNRNMTQWSQDDQDKGNELAGLILDYCTIVAKDVMFKLPQCTNDYVSIQQLLNNMTEMEVSTLPEEKQTEYTERYNKFFADNCELLVREIRQQDHYLDYRERVLEGFANNDK